MWSNLHGYIEMSLKYIFVFINEEKTHGEDFLIFENPEDAGMSGLLNSHEDAKTKQTLSQETERRVYSNMKYVNEEISYNRAYYHDHIAGIRRIIYNTYHDVIKENADTKFEVIHIPFTMSLYRKIMNLAQNEDDIPGLNTEEVCILLTHLSLFDEYAKASVAYAVCMHLLKNTVLLNYVKNYTNTNDNQSDSPLKYLSLLLFGKNDVSTQFKKAIKSYINFALWDKYENPSEIYSKSKIYCYHSCNIDPGNFSLAFFFDRLGITHQWLEKNQTILDTKFQENLGDSQYSVYIHNFFLENRNANIVDITMNNLKIVTTSKFLTSENIDELTLEFKNLSNRMDLSCLSKIKASIFVICDFCSFDFIRSIPENIKVSMRVTDDQPVHILNNIPKNVVEITFRSVNFHESMVFPSHIKRITLQWCNVDPYACFTINEECQNLEISRTQVQIIFPRVIECNLWHPLLMGKIKFSYKMENATNQGEFKLNVATINKILNMNENVSDVTFTHVKVSTGSYVTFNEKIKRLSITCSKGLFNLEPYIGQKYRFNKKMAIEILPVENSVANLSKIILKNFKFTERVKLSNNYERVELNHVHTTGDGEIILNKACKKLNILECSVVINARNVKDFKLLSIRFSVTEKNNIKFIGLTSVNHMCLTNICQCVDSIITMLTDRCEIKHLTFENKYSHETSELFSEYYGKMLRRLIYQEKYKSNLSSKLKCLIAKDVNSLVFMYTVPNAVVNFILHEILGKGGMTTISKLEFISVAIDVNSCMMLRKLQNLTILRICLANITSRFIYNLPTNLKLLDITDFSSENVSWATK